MLYGISSPSDLAIMIVDYVRTNATPLRSGLDVEQTLQRRLLDGRAAKLDVVASPRNILQLKLRIEPVRSDQWGLASVEEWPVGGVPTGDFHYLEVLVGDPRNAEETNARFGVYGESNPVEKTPTLIRDHAVALYHGTLRDIAALIENGNWRAG